MATQGSLLASTGPSRRSRHWRGPRARLTGASLEVISAWETPAMLGWSPNWPVGLDQAAIAEGLRAETVPEVLGAAPGKTPPSSSWVAAGMGRSPGCCSARSVFISRPTHTVPWSSCGRRRMSLASTRRESTWRALNHYRSSDSSGLASASARRNRCAVARSTPETPAPGDGIVGKRARGGVTMLGRRCRRHPRRRSRRVKEDADGAKKRGS